LDPDLIGSADSDPDRPKLAPNKGKNEEISCFKNLNTLCRGSTRHIVHGFWIKKCSDYNFTNFVITNLSNLGLDPEEIRFQQQAGSGSVFSEYGSEILKICYFLTVNNFFLPD